MNPLQEPSRTGARPGWHRLSRWLLLCALLGLGACSSTTFVYNRLHIILPWYVGTYVDLDREQKDYFRENLESLLLWHRLEELPLYLIVLDRVTGDLDSSLLAEDVAAVSAELEAAWFRLEAWGLELLLALGERLSDEQMEEFVGSLWEKQREYEEEYLSRSDREYRREAYKSLKDSMQDFLGRLDGAQRARLEAASDELLRSDKVWLQERRAWIERFERLLQREPGWQQAIRDTIDRRDEITSRVYIDTYGHNIEVIHAAIADVLNSRDERQDRRLRRELEKLREDLQTLIEQGETQAVKKAA